MILPTPLLVCGQKLLGPSIFVGGKLEDKIQILLKTLQQSYEGQEMKVGGGEKLLSISVSGERETVMRVEKHC